MNSMLQIFAQLPPLNNAFRNGTYKAMVNRNNKFGTGGQLSGAFAELLISTVRFLAPVVINREFERQGRGDSTVIFAP